MKLAAKIALSMVALLGVLFAIGGHVMIRQNFSHSLEQAVLRDADAHLRQKDLLRQSLATAHHAGQAIYDRDLKLAGDTITQAMGESGGALAILTDGVNPVFNSLPGGFTTSVRSEMLATGDQEYLFHQVDGTVYLIIPSTLIASGREVSLLSCFDVSYLFEERIRQQATFYIVYALLLAATVVLALLLSRLITRPLRRLGTASSRIAAGAYEERLALDGSDEMAQLAASFDEMAASIGEKVDSLNLSLRQKEDFIGAFTHELKTPMTAMMGYAALLEKDPATNESHRRALAYIHSETKRLEALSQKLLLLLGLSDETLDLSPVPLGDLFEKTRNALGDTKGVEVVFSGGGGACVWGDADLLVILLLNLIRNGVNARPADGRVRVLPALLEDRYIVYISDTGCGMSADQLDRIEEPFYRVDSARAKSDGGSGLGLAIAARVARLHGTFLRYESAPDAGTTVSFTLAIKDSSSHVVRTPDGQAACTPDGEGGV